jgi:hypothetical protein
MPNSGRWGSISWTRGWAAFPRPLLIAAAIVTVICLLGVIYFAATYGMAACTVCVTFNGRTECRTVSGASRDLAQATAHRAACAALATGAAETAACVQSMPVSSYCR